MPCIILFNSCFDFVSKEHACESFNILNWNNDGFNVKLVGIFYVCLNVGLILLFLFMCYNDNIHDKNEVEKT